jgi:hypothetical protein
MAGINLDENSVRSDDGDLQNGEGFPCACCSSVLTTKSIYGQHIRAIHANKTAADFNRLGTIKNFVDCPMCHLVYIGTRGLQGHRCDPIRATTRRNLRNLEAATVVAGAVTGVVVPPDPPDGQLNGETLNDLLSSLQHGLYYMHKAWIGLVNTLLIRCLSQICDGDGGEAERAMTAFLILPGLISEMRKAKLAPVNFLREAVASPDCVVGILAKGVVLMALKAANAPDHVPTRHVPTKEDLFKTTEKLVAMERFSPAIHCVNQVASLDAGEELAVDRLGLEAARAQLLVLNPTATDADVIPGDGSEDPVGLTITEAEVELGIRQLQHGSASGSSGWTNAAIQSVCLAAGDSTPLLTAITRFFNKCLQGTLSVGCKDLWTVSRAVLLPKKGGGWRPLGIGESWYRLMGRIVSKKVSTTIGQQLRPIQLACGTRGGCEIAARLGQEVWSTDTQGLIDGHLAVATLDIKNAFNTIRRGLVWSGVLKYCPSLARWFRCFYGGSSRLRLTSGDWVGNTYTGVKQGDPLAFAFFCMGMQQPLLDLQTELAARLQPGQLGGVWAYADDTSFFGPTATIQDLCHRAVDILASYNLEVVVRKCSILGSDVSNGGNNLFRVAPEGLVLMGNPIGTQDFRRQACEGMIEDMIKPLPQLKHLHAHSAFALLHYCINARPGYLARVAEPEVASVSLHRFDSAVDRVVMDICGGGLPSHQVGVLRELPQCLGGLGLARYHGLAGNQACLSSRLLCKTFLEDHFRDLLPSTNQWVHTSLQGRIEELASLNGEEATQDTVRNGEDTSAHASSPQPITLKSIKSAAFHERRTMQQTLLTTLRDAGQLAAASWLLSGSTPSAGRWLHARGGAFRQHEFTHQEFVDAFRLRLLLPPREDVGIVPLRCGCHNHVALEERPLHFLACDMNRSITISRHNVVRDTLVKLIKSCLPDATVGIEAELPTADESVLKVDIQYTMEHEAKYIDVMVVHPGAQTYLQRGSAWTEDTASKAGEEIKRAKYSVVPQLLQQGHFVPFVVEATGRLGPSAMQWIRALTAGKDVLHRSRCLSLISAAIARYNAKMIGAARGRAVVG